MIEKFRMSRGLIKFHTRTKNWNKSEENLNRAKPRRLQIDRQRLKFEFEDVRFRRHSITAHFIIFQPVTLPTPMYLVALPRYIYLCSVWPYLYLPMYLVAIPTSTYVPCGPTYIYLCTLWHYLYLPMYIVVWLTSTYVPCGLTYIYLCTLWPYLICLCTLWPYVLLRTMRPYLHLPMYLLALPITMCPHGENTKFSCLCFTSWTWFRF